MRRTRFVLAGLLGLLLTGCVGSGSTRVSATVSSPELVYVGPGLFVLADYPDPVFYADGYYWLSRDGYWFRSRVHNGYWQPVRDLPVVVRRIDRPARYVHYRGRGRVYIRDHRGRIQVRDARDHRRPGRTRL